MAKNLEEMRVYQHSTRAADAISALLKRPGFHNHRRYEVIGKMLTRLIQYLRGGKNPPTTNN
jgi:hypothetical protein